MKNASRKEKIIYALLIVFGLLMTFPVLALASNNIVFSIVAGSVLAIVGFSCYIFLKKALLPALLVSGVPLAIALLISFFGISSSDGGIFVLALALAIPVFSFLLIFMMLGGWIAMLVYKIRGAKDTERLPEKSEQNSEGDCAESCADIDNTEKECADKDKVSLRINIIIYTAFVLAILVINFLIFLFNLI